MNDEPLIDPNRVVEILRDCLFTNDELEAGQEEGDRTAPDNAVLGEGVMTNYAFNPQRLESYRLEITTMLRHLPKQFRPASVGGDNGWSFLNGCIDSNGTLWTGEQTTVEALFSLGMALAMVEWALPRDLWMVLPGGMPYVVVKV